MPPNLRRKAFSRERCGTDEIAGFQESLWTVARRKLDQIDSATDLQDLKIPPNNRLETLKGDRAGQYSIRINRQYRICFQWADQCATDVEIVDYH
ncbi:MAG: type II toxin-antitoxin system RelE/ParE family toxin [Spirulinaceae cyanobacterium]